MRLSLPLSKGLLVLLSSARVFSEDNLRFVPPWLMAAICLMAFVILISEASADVRMKPGRPPNDSWPRLVRQTILTDLTFSAPVLGLLDSDAPDDVDFASDEEDSRNERWQPSPQLINIFEPSPPAMRRDGDESRVDVVRTLMDVVILLPY